MRPGVVTQCVCCGVYLAVKEAVEVGTDANGEVECMCNRCYDDECDCYDEDFGIWQEKDEDGVLWTYRIIS